MSRLKRFTVTNQNDQEVAYISLSVIFLLIVKDMFETNIADQHKYMEQLCLMNEGNPQHGMSVPRQTKCKC